jgi:hypothetical protein
MWDEHLLGLCASLTAGWPKATGPVALSATPSVSPSGVADKATGPVALWVGHPAVNDAHSPSKCAPHMCKLRGEHPRLVVAPLSAPLLR